MRLNRLIAVTLCVAAASIFGSAGASAPPTTPTTAKPASAAAAQPLSPSPSAIRAPATPGAGSHDLNQADLEAWLDGLIPAALKADDIAGGVVVVVKDGKVLVQKGYGLADVARQVPMDPERTLIRPGSTSKLFTWTAVMQLVQAGKLDLDRDVNSYIDFKIPERFGKPITLRDLMNHRAGFEEGLKGIFTTDPTGLQSTEQYLKGHPRPMLFAPGTVPAYSNYGAALAGYIVQRVSGEPFDQYVERHILAPLGMTSTTFVQPLPEQFRSRMAQGYRVASGPPSPYELIVTRPAGSVSTSASDMARFMIAHLQDGRLGDATILSLQTAQLMHTPSEQGLPGFATMAHGFFYQERNGRTVIGHGGDSVVFHTEFDLLPQAGVGIFYTFNSRGKEDAVYGLREAVIGGFMDRYFPAPPADEPAALASARQDAPKIAGRYESSRRVQHGFISLFYLLQQSVIAANADGTISAPSEIGGQMLTYREVGPQVWRQVHGTHQLALLDVGGVKTVVDSDDPTSVLQAVSPLRSAGLNLPVLIVSMAVVVWTLLLWPLSPLLRRGNRGTLGVTPEVRRLRLYTRLAAAVAFAYAVGWFMLMQPLMSTQLGVYGPKLDGTVRVLQVAGLLVIAAALVSLWSAWRMFRTDAPWLSRIWSVVAAAGLVGVVWIAFMGRLLSFTLNY